MNARRAVEVDGEVADATRNRGARLAIAERVPSRVVGQIRVVERHVKQQIRIDRGVIAPLVDALPVRVKLLIEWIQHKAPGAQCNPDFTSGKSCTVDSSGRNVVATCKSDWNFDMSTAVPCTNGCNAGQCL